MNTIIASVTPKVRPLRFNEVSNRSGRLFTYFMAIFFSLVCSNGSAAIIYKFDFIEFSTDSTLASLEYSALPASFNDVTSLRFTELGALRLGVNIGEFPIFNASGSSLVNIDPILPPILVGAASHHFVGTGTSEGQLVWITFNSFNSPTNSLLEMMTVNDNFQASGAWFQVPEPNVFAFSVAGFVVLIFLRSRREKR
jgi:hypothetical protein